MIIDLRTPADIEAALRRFLIGHELQPGAKVTQRNGRWGIERDGWWLTHNPEQTALILEVDPA